MPHPCRDAVKIKSMYGFALKQVNDAQTPMRSSLLYPTTCHTPATGLASQLRGILFGAHGEKRDGCRHRGPAGNTRPAHRNGTKSSMEQLWKAVIEQNTA